jgi:hypothetical protein
MAADAAEPPTLNSTNSIIIISSSSNSSSNSGHHQHGLEQLTTLTAVVLSGVSVKLNGLPALTGLQDL